MNKMQTREDFEKVILELKVKLSRLYRDFTGISFFGSRQSGDFSSDSDFDIVVLFSKKPHWKRENTVLNIIYETELKYDILIDAKVYYDKDIMKQNTPFRETVWQEGTFYGV